MSADIHSLVGAYALDALDDVERAAFDRHLRECPSCRAEADELRETAARLAEGAWSAPPPGLRDDVLAAVTNTRQLPATSPRRSRPPLRLRWVAAAAAVVAAVGAGTAVFVIQDQRVRREQALAAEQTRVHAVLDAPDVVWHEEPLTGGGRVRVATSRSHAAGVILLSADQAPAAGHVYQLWTIRGGVPASAGALGEGQSVATQVVEDLPDASAVGVTVETAPASSTPTAPMQAQVDLA
jgi:anti-sigma factor RsiW